MDEHHELLSRLRSLGSQPLDSARQSADLTAMAAAVPRARFAPKLRVAGAFLAGLLIGSTGLAAADVLPDPAQHIAHGVLERVRVSVPDPERYHGPECGSEAKKNHGSYVRDDKTLAQSECGKKVKVHGDVDDAPDGNEAPEGPKAPKAAKTAKADKGPCHGKPPWAGNKTMTAPEVEASKAERLALCGPDAGAGADEPDDVDEAEVGGGTQ